MYKNIMNYVCEMVEDFEVIEIVEVINKTKSDMKSDANDSVKGINIFTISCLR